MRPPHTIKNALPQTRAGIGGLRRFTIGVYPHVHGFIHWFFSFLTGKV